MRIFEATVGPSVAGAPSLDYIVSESLPVLKFLSADALVTTGVGSTPNAQFIVFNKALQVRYAVATAALVAATASRISFGATGVATNNTNVLVSPTPTDFLLMPGDLVRFNLLNSGPADIIGAALLTFELLQDLDLEVFNRLPR